MTNDTLTISRELVERLLNELSQCSVRNELRAILATPVVERQEPYGFASVLVDTFQSAIDNGKQPTFSKGDLLYFIEQLSKCQSTSPPGPVAVVMPEPNLEAAAKTLAACMDYPWEHMPEQGRASMRAHAKAVIYSAKKLNQ